MTECPSHEHFAKLLANQPDDAESETLVDHLGECAECQKLLEELSVDSHEWRHLEQRLMTTSIHWPGLSGDDNDNTVPIQWPEISGYELISIAGQGGMGVVFRARQTILNRLVALKMLRSGWQSDEDFRRRFRREAETLAHLHHPNLVQVYDLIDQDDGPFLAMEFVSGGSLAERLRRSTLAAGEAARLVEILARAVQCAHDAGIVHRDLKPANVLLAHRHGHQAKTSGAPTVRLAKEEFVPKITDFGLARRYQGQMETHPGEVMGTPCYMAPEQARGAENWSRPAADIYALGAVLYETITSRPPFQGPSAFATLMMVAKEDPVPPSRLQAKLPRDLETICLKCLEKDPARRYQSCTELADDLRRFQTGKPIHARPTSIPAKTFKAAKRHPVVAALSTAIALALLVLLGVWAGFTSELAIQKTALAAQNKKVRAERREAVRQKNEAIKQKKLTENAHALAAARLLQTQLALLSTEKALRGIHVQIEKQKELNNPKLQAVRRRLLQKCYDLYVDHLGGFGDEPRMALARAEGYRWAGEASFKLGNIKKAQYYLRRAITIQKALTRNVASGDEAGSFGQTRLSLAHVLTDQGKLKEAEKECRLAIDLLDKHTAKNDDAHGYLFYLLARANQQHGYVISKSKKLKRAADTENRLLAARTALKTALSRNAAKDYYELGVQIENTLCSYYKWAKQPIRAKEAFDQARLFESKLN